MQLFRTEGQTFLLHLKHTIFFGVDTVLFW